MSATETEALLTGVNGTLNDILERLSAMEVNIQSLTYLLQHIATNQEAQTKLLQELADQQRAPGAIPGVSPD